MIQFYPNINTDVFEISDQEWIIIRDFLKYLNKMEIVPIISEENLMDMECFDGYALSSYKVNSISDMICKSIQNKTFENYRYKYNNYDDLRFPVLFPEDVILKFLDFLRMSNGFYISSK
jgi:hypothetical protein